MEAIERIQGFACRVNPIQWKELLKVTDELGIFTNSNNRSRKSFERHPYAGLSKDCQMMRCFFVDDHETLIPFEEFLAKLKGEQPQQTTPFAEQVAANIIKISCNKDIPYADKMNMVVQAILEFERNPKNQQPKNEKA